MDLTALDAAVTALTTHLAECDAEAATTRVASSITDEYKRALGHDATHIAELLGALSATRSLLTGLDAEKLTQAQADALYAPLGAGGVSLSDVYPIGSVYLSILPTSPAVLFGFGTWAAFATGRCVVGVDVGQVEFATVELTGGAKTHTLAANEMPVHTHVQDAHNHTQNPHTHVITSQTATSGSATSYEHGVLDTSSAEAEATEVTGSTTATCNTATAVNQNAGGGAAHNNLQPYVTAYFWKRTA